MTPERARELNNLKKYNQLPRFVNNESDNVILDSISIFGKDKYIQLAMKEISRIKSILRLLDKATVVPS